MGSSSKAKARRPGTKCHLSYAGNVTHLDLPWCWGGGGGGGGGGSTRMMVRSSKKLT